MASMPVLDIFSEWLRAHGRTQRDVDRYALRFTRLRPLESAPVRAATSTRPPAMTRSKR